jgi:hypothetical protein
LTRFSGGRIASLQLAPENQVRMGELGHWGGLKTRGPALSHIRIWDPLRGGKEP